MSLKALKKSKRKPKTQKAFTLSELLVVIAVLGIIGTFTISKILVSSQLADRRAIVKETFSTLNGVLYAGQTSGLITNKTNLYTYLQNHLNAIKICPNDAAAEGCWDNTVQGVLPGGRSDSPGFILANGARITIQTYGPGDGGLGTGEYVMGFDLDWNGLSGPNLYDTTAINNDQTRFSACYGQVACSTWFYPILQTGQIGSTSTSGNYFLNNL